MTLIDNWRQAWRFLSVRISAFGAAAMVVFPELPDDTQLKIVSVLGLKNPVAALALVLFVLAILGRVKAQPKLHAPPGDGDLTERLPPPR